MTSSIDKLLDELAFNNVPMATWPGRHGCAFLDELAEAYAKWPTMFGGYADRVLRFANYWSRERREPILGMERIDRQGSFLGGFPWTSSAHPWPTNSAGQALAPILQLNLDTLNSGPLGVKDASLFQVWAWADNGQPFFRSIPLAETTSGPDWTLLPWSASDMYYRFEGFNDADGWKTPTDLEWFKNRVVGETVKPALEWEFSFGRELENEPDEVQLCDSVPDKVREAWERLEELTYTIPQLCHIYYDEEEILSGFFGGQMYSQRGGYGNFPAYRTLYSPREGASYGSEQPGLFIWFDGAGDGKLSVLFNVEDHSDIIAYTD